MQTSYNNLKFTYCNNNFSDVLLSHIINKTSGAGCEYIFCDLSYLNNII